MHRGDPIGSASTSSRERSRLTGAWLRLVGGAGIAGIQAVVVFCLLEVICRLADPLGISYYPETARYLDTMIVEEPIGYRNRPGLRGEFYGVPVAINSLGMRDSEIPSKGADEFRILVLGDSVPFGIGVDFDETIPSQLEEILNQAAPPHRTYRTLNMGVPSYNTEQELLQLKTLGLSLEPDVAVLLFSLNDIERKKWVFEKRASWYADLAQRSYATSFLFVLIRQLRSAVGRPEQLISVGEYHADSPRWQVIKRSLLEISQRCKDRRIGFIVVTSLAQLGAESRMLEEVGQQSGFEVVNLSTSSDPRWAHRDRLELANSRVDSHPNPEGSRAFAVMIAEHLGEAGFLAGSMDKHSAEARLGSDASRP